MTSKSSFFALTGTAATSAEDFDIRYLGAKDIAPLTDNNGNSLVNGALYFNLTSDTFWAWDGTAWIENATGGGGGVTDHGALTGLLDDDHTQYHTDARGDARYSLLAHSHSGLAPAGGATGEVLKKVSGTNYDYSWQADATGGGGVTDGDKGDITVSASGATWTIDANVVTNAKAAQMATKTYKGRTSAATGNAEDVPVATLKTDLALTKSDVGLANVDNTSDLSKPVSTATQTSLNLKANLASPTFTGTVSGITAAMVGAPSGSGSSSGTNTGDQTSIVGITGTKAQFDTAVTDGNFMYVGDAPTSHTHTLANVSDVTMTVANLNALDDGVNTALHFHDTDRSRANHTGTQTASTISDFNSAADARIAAAVIDNLSDVVITTPTTNQVLKYNGTNWTNQADATGGGGGLTDSDYGDVVVSGGATVFTVESAAGAFAFKGVLTPAQITANQNDYAPAGLSTATTLRLSSDNDSRTITGITGGAVGRVLTLENVGTTDIILTHEDAGSTAANRIDNGGGAAILTSRGTVDLKYDATLSRWHVVGITGDDANAVGLRRQPFFSSDFLVPTGAANNPPFVGTAISTGTIAANATNSTANHPGICRMTSSTTANGGYRWQTDGTAGKLIGGGESFEIVFAPLNFTTTTFRAGYYDSTTSADCVDGIYFEYTTTGNLVGKTSSNSVRTTSATITTLSLNTWYRGVIVVNNNATSVTFTVYDANGVSLGTQTVTTNIPTGAGRQTAVGCIATESSVTATAMVDLDYMAFNFGTTRPLLR